MQKSILKVIAASMLIVVYSGCSKINNNKDELKKTETKTDQSAESKEQKKDTTAKTIKYAGQSEDELMSKNITNF